MWFICYQTSIFLYLITVRNEVAKVMFLHVSVILFTGGGVLSQHALQVVSQHALQQGGLLWGGCLFQGGSAPGGVCSQGVPALGGLLPVGVPAPRGSVEPPPPKADGYCCGRYASYWNTFLFENDLTFLF